MNKLTKQILIVLGTVVLFLALSYGYMPDLLSGKVVNQSDISSWQGMTREVYAHNAAHPDDRTQWTNSMFGGMPTAAMIDDFQGDWTKPLYRLLLLGKRPATYIFVTLVGALLLMLAFGVNWVLAVGAAIAMAFCSYNMQIIQVGHNTKMQAIAFMPWVLAALVYTYRRRDKNWLPKTVLGAALFGITLSFQIKANHPQISYYLAIIIIGYAIAVFVEACRKKEFKRFFTASALLLVLGLTGIATNANKLVPTYEYSKYTMRGGSELSAQPGREQTGGLDLEYATAWSYGIEEMPNLMIPNYNGGASSGALDKDSETYRLLQRAGQPNLREVIKHMPLYWGPQPFTAGPMYLGAICCFLFILGCCLLKGKEKWWLIVVSIIAVFLAWGNHFMWFTRLWFNYAPMYNKFRTVSMALTVLQVTVPLMGFLVLDRIFKGEYGRKEVTKATVISFALTGGFCLLMWLVPGIAGDFVAASDADMQEIVADALAMDRRSLLRSDALRSFVLIACAFGLILWTLMGKGDLNKRACIAGGALALIVLFDLFTVDKRYLNSDHFVTKKDFRSVFEPRPVDEMIKRDKDPEYRVLDLSVNTFNDAIQCYHHKCIGGYSPVKMQRYQDLIERNITKEISAFYKSMEGAATVSEVQEGLPFLPVVSMLNGKYIIIGGEYAPVQNPYAFGNCWFVDRLVPAANPDEEIALLGAASFGDLESEVNICNAAIVGADFKWAQEKMNSCADGSEEDLICLTSYAPNELKYNYRTSAERPVLFSEVYYPHGWKAWVEPADGSGKKEIELFRANWILRGAVLPDGEGELVMRFEPEADALGAGISRASSILLILLVLLSGGYAAWAVRKEASETKE